MNRFKYLISFMLLSHLLYGTNLEITATKFYHKESDRRATFSGNVIAREEGNLIKSNRLIVYLDEKNEAIEYRASGRVYFEIKDGKKNRNIVGRCHDLRYLPNKDTYYLEGGVKIEDLVNKRKVFGDQIIIDNKNNISIAKSLSKKPVKFVFKLKDKNAKKEKKKSKK